MRVALPMEYPPSWAADYCYYFYFLAAIQLVTGLIALFKLGAKNLGVSAVILLSILINAVTTMTLFWMCRASLVVPSKALVVRSA